MDRFVVVAIARTSFEEIRIDDYLRAYRSTGRPPAPQPHPLPFEPLLVPEDSIHHFTPTQIDSEVFHTLTAMPLYRFFSLEELRANAYLCGNKLPPTPIDHVPFVRVDSQEQLVTISAQPKYAAHSLEELRIASIRAGAHRDLSSAEILARPNPAPKTPFGTVAYPFAPL